MNQAKARKLGMALLCLLSTFASQVLLAQQADKDCQCRAPGGIMRALGTVECVRIGGRSKLVTCAMSTNTPYWKDIENVDGCPTA